MKARQAKLSNSGKGSSLVEGTSSMRSGETTGATSSAAATPIAQGAAAIAKDANAIVDRPARAKVRREEAPAPD
jgi:hypothetical protein